MEEKDKLENKVGDDAKKLDRKILYIRNKIKEDKKAAKKKQNKYATKDWVLEIANKLQGSRGGGNVTVSITPPAHPNLHQLWVDIS